MAQNALLLSTGPASTAVGRARAEASPLRVELGPYCLTVEFRDRARLQDRRKLACVNMEHARIELRDDLEGLRLAAAFFECVIRLSHFSKGCQQGCIEEAYTQSFATGLVEFAQRNPRTWRWFNGLLTEHLPGDVRYDSVVSGAVARPPPMPRRILVAGHPVRLRSISRAACGTAFGWYLFSAQEAQLFDGLRGANLAVVALHEITHAVHHIHAIADRDKHHNFRRAQLKGWMSIMKHSPGAWRWLAWLMSFPAQARLESGPAERRRAANTYARAFRNDQDRS